MHPARLTPSPPLTLSTRDARTARRTGSRSTSRARTWARSAWSPPRHSPPTRRSRISCHRAGTAGHDQHGQGVRREHGRVRPAGRRCTRSAWRWASRSLTVEEQATTFATLAAGGKYATPHVIARQLTQNGNNVPLKITYRQVLTPAQAADVDYALSFDTVNGTADGFPGPAQPRPPDHRQDRHHRRGAVSVLHRRDPAVLAGGRDVHEPAERAAGRAVAEHPSLSSSATRPAATAAPGRRRSGRPT